MIFLVRAIPIANPRQRQATINGHARNYTPAKHPIHQFKEAVRADFLAAGGVMIPEGPVTLLVNLIMPRPKNMMWKRKPMPRAPMAGKPDATNLLKGIEDALNGLAWHDDSQIAQLAAGKYRASGSEQPGCEISISEFRLLPSLAGLSAFVNEDL